jgi:hypothetical protein
MHCHTWVNNCGQQIESSHFLLQGDDKHDKSSLNFIFFKTHQFDKKGRNKKRGSSSKSKQ